MKHIRKGLALTVISIAAAGIWQASPAAAYVPGNCEVNEFCGFKDNLYKGGFLIESAAPAGSNHVEIADNLLSSGNNRSGTNTWLAINDHSWPQDDETSWRFFPNTAVPAMTGANDEVDWFDVR
ncbi:MAG TPA: hypothetical protein VM097_05015 [Mycobacteriales bacterium]|nr:hypothetical protein [Mycobacteriales bacterium]